MDCKFPCILHKGRPSCSERHALLIKPPQRYSLRPVITDVRHIKRVATAVQFRHWTAEANARTTQRSPRARLASLAHRAAERARLWRSLRGSPWRRRGSWRSQTAGRTHGSAASARSCSSCRSTAGTGDQLLGAKPKKS